MTGTLMFHVPGHEELGARIARALDIARGELVLRDFPDGETYARGDTDCDGADVLLAACLFRPDPLLLPVIYAAEALRARGARRVVLVSPYLPYLRQDARFQPGEVVTSRVFARLLSGAVDGLVTVDPHLHRFRSLADIYTIPTRAVSAAPAIAAWISANVDDPLIVGPDRESEQWVGEVAEMADAPCVVLSKTRHGDDAVEVELPPLDPFRESTPVLVDDIISTGATMIEVIAGLGRAGYVAPVCIGVHAVFAARAYSALQAAGAARIVTCNTIKHASNSIDVTNPIAAGARRWLEQDAQRDGGDDEAS